MLFPARAAAALLVCALCSLVHAADLYVSPTGSDANPGTIDRPKRTIVAGNYAAKPGDTVYLRGGTYPITTQQWLGNPGSAEKWIHLTAYADESPIIDATGLTTSGGDTALMIAARYLKVSKLTVRNSPRGGITVGNTWDVVVEDCVSHGHGWGGLTAYGDTWGSTGNVTFKRNTVYDVVRTNRHQPDQGSWPSTIGASIVDNFVALDNVSRESWGEGLMFSRVRGGWASGNVILDCFSLGIYLDNATDVDVVSNNVYSTGNTAHYRFGRPMTGIGMANEPYSTRNPIARCGVFNNLVAGCGFGLDYDNWGSGGWRDTVIANNTIYGSTEAAVKLSADSGVTGNYYRNNLVQNTGTVPRVWIYTSSAGITRSHNLWYGGTAGATVLAGANDRSGDPKLANPSQVWIAESFRPGTGSAALGGGMNLSWEVTYNYAWEARPTSGAWSIGAY